MSMYVAYVGPVDSRNRLTMVVLDTFKGVEALKVADLPNVTPNDSPAMCYGESKLHVFVHDGEYKIHEITFDPVSLAFSYVGPIAGASTNDRMAALFNPASAEYRLFFQDSGVIKEASRSGSGSWSVATVSGAERCDWGPAACYRGGDVNLAYCSNNKVKVGYIQSGTLVGVAPSSGISMWWSPALTNYQDPLVSDHGRLFCTFVWQNTNNINYVTNRETTGWSSSEEINARNCVDGGPATCVYNNNIYMFSQGAGNKLLYTIFALQSWPDDNSGDGWCANFTSVKFEGKPIDNVYYAPAVVSTQ